MLQECKIRAVYAWYSLLGHMTTPALRVLLSFTPLSRMIEEKAELMTENGALMLDKK